jgi:hypothetical protein
MKRFLILIVVGCGARTELGDHGLLDAQAVDVIDAVSDGEGEVNICPLSPPTGGGSCTRRTFDGSAPPPVMECLYAPQTMGGTAPERYFVCGSDGQWGFVTNVGGAHCSDVVCHPEQSGECIENGVLCCRACDPTSLQFVDCGPC